MHTFTQLVRMKVFYFLGVFALILLASNLFNIQSLDRPDLEGVDVLRSIRSWSLGTMTLFSVVLGIVATALLLPKDVEDRTLYTILAKPVPRLDYLVGKLGGVLLLLFASLLVMDLLMTGVLAIRSHLIVEAQEASALKAGWPKDQIEAMQQGTLRQGATWDLQGAVLLVFLRSVVVSSTALMLSIISTSTLFTTITGFIVYFMGNFHKIVRETYFEGHGTGPLERFAGLVIAAIFPNFEIYNPVDEVIAGQVLTSADLAGPLGMTAFYLVLHVFVSWLMFSKKEF